MSAALRAREQAALARIAATVGFTFTHGTGGRLLADDLEDLAGKVEARTFQAGYAAGQHDALEQLAGPVPDSAR